jgi:hypothetical protein
MTLTLLDPGLISIFRNYFLKKQNVHLLHGYINMYCWQIILDHKTRPGKFEMTEVKQDMFAEHTDIKLDVNNTVTAQKSSNIHLERN